MPCLVERLAPASSCAGNRRQGCLDCAAAPQVHYGLFSGSSMFDVSEAKDKCCG